MFIYSHTYISMYMYVYMYIYMGWIGYAEEDAEGRIEFYGEMVDGEKPANINGGRKYPPVMAQVETGETARDPLPPSH